MNNYLGWTNEQIEDLINRVYGGVVNQSHLPEDLFEAVLTRLSDAIIEGFGGVEEGTNYTDLEAKFQTNIQKFSYGKTFHLVSDMRSNLVDGEGNKLSFSDFKKEAKKHFDIYNGEWLKTEFNTAYNVAQRSSDFVRYMNEAEGLPLLKYDTVGDGKVRASHRKLDGIVKPVHDPFWDTYAPVNDFNCRCILIQLEEGEEAVTDTKDLDLSEVVPELFRNNPAKTGKVFDDNHPYFNGLTEREDGI